MLPKKGCSGMVTPGAKSRDHLLAVQRDDLDPGVGEVVGQEAGAVAEAVVGVGDRQIDLEDVDLQRVAGLRALDRDRPGQDVAAGSAVVDVVVDLAQAGLDVGGRDAGLLQAGRAVGQQGVEDHRVAGLDAQHRLGRRVVVAPGDGGRRGGQVEGLGVSAVAIGDEQAQEAGAHGQTPGGTSPATQATRDTRFETQNPN